MKIALFIILVLSQFHSGAQILQGHYFPFGLGYARQTVMDQTLSPVSYTGGIGQITTGYYYQNKNWRSIFDLTGFGGFQKPDVNPEGNHNRTILVSGRAQYSLSYRVFQNDKWKVFAGILNHNIWDFRQVRAYSNSSANYNGFAAIGGLLTVQREFQLFNQDFGFQYALGLPIGAYFLRPGYIKPFKYDNFGEKGWSWVGDFYLIDSRTDLYWKLNELNHLRLSYHWEYFSFHRLNKIQAGTHLLSVSTILKF